MRQLKLIFPTEQLVFDADAQPESGESHWLEYRWGKSEVWWLPALSGSGRLPAVIVCHGQVGLIDGWEQRMTSLRKLGYHCLLVEYPGYGRSQGEPVESQFTDVLVGAYDWLVKRDDVDPHKIIGLGRSMGGGVISLLTEHRKLSHLWLMSTFTSLKPFMRKKGIPGWLLKSPLNNLKRIRRHQIPTLIIHGAEDNVVPAQHGRQLASAAADADLILEKADHDNCPRNWDEFWRTAVAFVEHRE